MAVGTRWLSNFRETELWGSAESHDWLLKLPQFSMLRQEADQNGSRIRVFYTGRGDVPPVTGWANAADLGPVGIPEVVPPQQPDFARAPGGGGPFLSNFRATAMRARPAGDEKIADALQFSVFAQLLKQNGPRILGYYYGNDATAATPAWIEALDLGPIPQPNTLPPPEPRVGNGSGGVVGGGGPADPGLWTEELGAAIAGENLWRSNGQPRRKAAMVEFNQLPIARRREIFDGAMRAALTAEGITSANHRESWMGAMRIVVRGGTFEGKNVIAECPDLNPFMLAGESGGVFRGGADVLNSSALGYFQFIATNPNGSDFGHWTRFMAGQSRSLMTNPTSQVQEFIRGVRLGTKHHGDPWSVVREKADTGVWGPG